MSLDLLVENARIVDGTGAPWFRGAVGVVDGRIDRIATAPDHGLDADTRIDADGSVVSPGFIDAHSHSDLELFADPSLAPKTRQGITTEILGQDGFSMAPLYREEGIGPWQEYLSGLAGRLEREWTWNSLGEYLDAVDDANIAPNVATLVGHGTARYDVLGMDDVQPTDDEVEEMAALVREGFEDGAIGFSTGLVYTPQVYSETEEVSRLAAELAPYGRPFVAHIRSEGRWIWEALDEFVDIGADHDIPLQISHFKVTGSEQQGKADRLLAQVETARERGVDVTADQYPYTAGSSMLTSLLPPWVQSGDADALRETLSDPDQREEIRRDIEEWRIDGWENVGGKTGWDRIEVTNLTSEEFGEEGGRDIATIATERDSTPIDVLCDVLLAEDFEASMIAHGLIEEDVRTIMGSERVMVGTDGLFGARPHPRVYGSFPRILAKYVRQENLLSLEEAVRSMTSLPARAMGLDSKGVLRPGLDADLVVFDPAVVDDRATFDDPEQYPLGIEHVVVDGTPIVRDGEDTGARPGGAIRA
ncbi:N-acyl-D-amino-acid deacylase family protein [Natronosalvus caseinilyticus]|uniref:N-acyl-D-amino-acid deacylase family protein n=1 Tax=Natronosalvus caseinilyticus TaxID=2953747 RepID=UPI0028AA9067|nr:D-aminoacylase [Natronosalvus caseinilyticus]